MPNAFISVLGACGRFVVSDSCRRRKPGGAMACTVRWESRGFSVRLSGSGGAKDTFSTISLGGPFDAMTVKSAFGERFSVRMMPCFERLPDEDEEEWRECKDALERSEKLARAEVVLSRAIAARERRFCFEVTILEAVA